VSVGQGGVQGNGFSEGVAISANGRFVAFASGATNLVPRDTNREEDVFIRDRKEGTTERVSIASSGAQGNGDSHGGLALSANGRFIAFTSDATNLVPDDTNDARDLFVHDRVTGKTERVSVSSDGVQGNRFSESPALSANGRFVAFYSAATNLVPGDTNDANDAFVHDRKTGKTIRVSISSGGVQANENSFDATLSADGQAVAFDSRATNLVPNDTNDTTDVFVRDR
jgi:Tol biopolymer transport system component